MNVYSHVSYVVLVLAAMILIELSLGEIARSTEIGLMIVLGLVIPASMVLAGRVGKLTTAGLVAAGFSLWLLAWVSVILILRSIVESSGFTFTINATVAQNWAEMLTSAVVFVGGSVLWKGILQRTGFVRSAT